MVYFGKQWHLFDMGYACCMPDENHWWSKASHYAPCGDIISFHVIHSSFVQKVRGGASSQSYKYKVWHYIDQTPILLFHIFLWHLSPLFVTMPPGIYMRLSHPHSGQAEDTQSSRSSQPDYTSPTQPSEYNSDSSTWAFNEWLLQALSTISTASGSAPQSAQNSCAPILSLSNRADTDYNSHPVHCGLRRGQEVACRWTGRRGRDWSLYCLSIT